MANSVVYVNSSAIERLEYEDFQDKLTVHFHNGSQAFYYQVSRDEFLQLASAKSVGSEYARNFKGKKLTRPNTLKVGDSVSTKAPLSMTGTYKVIEVGSSTVDIAVTVLKDQVVRSPF